MRALALMVVLGSVAPIAAQPPPAKHVTFEPVGYTDARWTTGFWADRFETCRTATVPDMGTLMEGTDRSHFLHNFRIAAGLEAGKHRGPPWNDGDYYKWLEAASAVFAVTKDAALDRRMDDAIAVIAKAQRADGYLHTPVLIAARNGADAKPFQDRLNFEMYNFGHLFTAACVHHRATGKKSLLEVAVKAADFLCAAFEKPTPELARNAVCPAHYMGTIDLYRLTGDKKYLALAVKFLDLRDLAPTGTDDNQDRIPFRKQTEAIGHAVRANYLYAGAADVFAETGDETLLEPLKKIWANVVSRKMYLTGACGALYDGASPDGSKDQKQIARVHQSYGRDWQLPNSTAHNETCAAIGNVLWNWLASLLETGNSQPTLRPWRVRFPSAGFLHKCKLACGRIEVTPTPCVSLTRCRCHRAGPDTPLVHHFYLPRVAQANTYAYGRSDRGVWVHLFGVSTLNTTLPNGRFKLKQETEYPWAGVVKITVEEAPAGEMSLFVRVPGWADGAKLTVNGTATDAPAGCYAEVRRAWKAGDVVELALPMTARLIESHPLVEETRNQVAVMRGPLVYCLESPDLPKGTSVQAVALPRSAKFAPRFGKTLLGGVMVLEGKAELVAEREWGNELYRPLTPADPKPLAIALVPYFAWANRGKSEMTVWMPPGR